MLSQFTFSSSPDSTLGRLDARWKLAAILFAITIVLVLRSPLCLSLAFIGSLVLAVWARIPIRRLLSRLGAIALLLLPFAVLLPSAWSGSTSWSVPVSQLYLKALSTITLTMVVLDTAPLGTTLKAARAMGVPGLPLHLLMMAHRYVFLLSQEFLRMRIAIRVRGFHPRINSHTYRTIAHLAGTLFVRGYERSERVGHAMRCRGFTGKFHSVARFRTRRADVVFLLLVAAVSATLVVWDYTRL